MPKLKWKTHADLSIRKTPSVGRGEYLDHMTFASNERPLFTEIFGPLLGLKEEWEEQGATPEELDFSAFAYRCEARGGLPAGQNGPERGLPEGYMRNWSSSVDLSLPCLAVIFPYYPVGLRL